MLFVIHLQDRPDAAALRQQIGPAHRAYVQAHADKIALGGPLLAEDGATMIGSLIILDCASRAEAEAFVAAEPYSAAGLFDRVSILPFRPVLATGALGPTTRVSP